MRILVCVKYVPDSTDDAEFTSDHTLARPDDAGLLSELDEYAIEQALQLRGRLPAPVQVTAVCMGPDGAETALRKALQMGADDAVLICDEAIAGSDVFASTLILAAAAGKIGDVGLIVCGMSSPDAGTGVLPALLAERLGWPLLSLAAQVDATGSGLAITRTDELGTRTVQAALPAVLSVTDQSGQPRYPTFKDVLSAKKKPLDYLELDDLEVPAVLVGSDAARVQVIGIVRNPDRAAGRVLPGDSELSLDELASFVATALQ